eukprot:TRINITY_DN4396_c0_g1_i1.p1 TRINITY_DN4396_c0_g1~~TRINITY_DN4396_c0_g1_i1.p1  ORF type:complete len:790 (+),score=151.34 TRINITY_DN4396_c0_g1_i1:133-2502(+)
MATSHTASVSTIVVNGLRLHMKVVGNPHETKGAPVLVKLSLASLEETKKLTSVGIVVVGRYKLHWKPDGLNSSSQSTKLVENFYTAKPINTRGQPANSALVLKPNEPASSFEVQFALPANLPSSFEFYRHSVYYTLKPYVELSSFTGSTKLYFSGVEQTLVFRLSLWDIIELTQQSWPLHPLTCSQPVAFFSKLLERNPAGVDLEAIAPRSVVKFGETIPIVIFAKSDVSSIANGPSAAVTYTHLALELILLDHKHRPTLGLPHIETISLPPDGTLHHVVQYQVPPFRRNNAPDGKAWMDENAYPIPSNMSRHKHTTFRYEIRVSLVALPLANPMRGSSVHNTAVADAVADPSFAGPNTSLPIVLVDPAKDSVHTRRAQAETYRRNNAVKYLTNKARNSSNGLRYESLELLDIASPPLGNSGDSAADNAALSIKQYFRKSPVYDEAESDHELTDKPRTNEPILFGDEVFCLIAGLNRASGGISVTCLVDSDRGKGPFIEDATVIVTTFRVIFHTDAFVVHVPLEHVVDVVHTTSGIIRTDSFVVLQLLNQAAANPNPISIRLSFGKDCAVDSKPLASTLQRIVKNKGHFSLSALAPSTPNDVSSWSNDFKRTPSTSSFSSALGSGDEDGDEFYSIDDDERMHIDKKVESESGHDGHSFAVSLNGHPLIHASTLGLWVAADSEAGISQPLRLTYSYDTERLGDLIEVNVAVFPIRKHSRIDYSAPFKLPWSLLSSWSGDELVVSSWINTEKDESVAVSELPSDRDFAVLFTLVGTKDWDAKRFPIHTAKK